MRIRKTVPWLAVVAVVLAILPSAIHYVLSTGQVNGRLTHDEAITLLRAKYLLEGPGRILLSPIPYYGYPAFWHEHVQRRDFVEEVFMYYMGGAASWMLVLGALVFAWERARILLAAVARRRGGGGSIHAGESEHGS